MCLFAVGQTDGSCFLGATPEILVEVFGRKMKTQAVAGTVSRGADADQDATFAAALLRSDKDRSEHQVVANVLAQALAPLCSTLERSATPEVVALPRLQHLVTSFSGTLRGAGGVLELIHRLHPTPSVGGWPADRALAWLARHEPLQRGYYAGPDWLADGRRRMASLPWPFAAC